LREGTNLHLVVENLGLVGGGGRDEEVIKNVQDVITDGRQLLLDLAAVVLDAADVVLVTLVLLLLLDRGDNAPRGTTGTNNVLVGDREQVTLLNSELDLEVGDLLHGLNHLVVAGR
jgi:hypothetical protein